MKIKAVCRNKVLKPLGYLDLLEKARISIAIPRASGICGTSWASPKPRKISIPS